MKQREAIAGDVETRGHPITHKEFQTGVLLGSINSCTVLAEKYLINYVHVGGPKREVGGVKAVISKTTAGGTGMTQMWHVHVPRQQPHGLVKLRVDFDVMSCSKQLSLPDPLSIGRKELIMLWPIPSLF